MKKILFSMMAFLASSGIAIGQNALTVGNFTLPQNGGTMRVTLTLAEKNVYTGYQFKIETPDGMGYVTDQEDDVACTLGTGHSNSHSATAHWNEATRLLTVGVSSTSSALLSGQTIILDIPMSATSASVGTTHNFNITGIDFIKQENATKVSLSDVPFTVTIGEPADTRTILDETSTVTPAAVNGVDVRVRRTINANDWSTICLPFAMTEAQTKEAFGNDVQLANMTSWSPEENGNEDIVGINVVFTSVTAIEANHPYIIKVSSPITEFTVDNVNIDPEEEPYVKVGNKASNRGWMTGTYVANFTVPENNLFLSGGKFWYSKGNTKMKAFRAHFEFADVLTSVESSAPVFMTFENGTTGISEMGNVRGVENDAFYNLKGQRVMSPAKGLYIKNNKKVIVK